MLVLQLRNMYGIQYRLKEEKGSNCSNLFLVLIDCVEVFGSVFNFDFSFYLVHSLKPIQLEPKGLYCLRLCSVCIRHLPFLNLTENLAEKLPSEFRISPSEFGEMVEKFPISKF